MSHGRQLIQISSISTFFVCVPVILTINSRSYKSVTNNIILISTFYFLCFSFQCIVSKVVNVQGPQTSAAMAQHLTSLIKTPTKSRRPVPNKSSVPTHSSGVEERLRNMESHLQMKRCKYKIAVIFGDKQFVSIHLE